METIFGREVDLVSRRGIERSPNYLRRKAILESAELLLWIVTDSTSWIFLRRLGLSGLTSQALRNTNFSKTRNYKIPLFAALKSSVKRRGVLLPCFEMKILKFRGMKSEDCEIR